MYLIEGGDQNRESEAIRLLLSNPLHHERLADCQTLGVGGSEVIRISQSACVNVRSIAWHGRSIAFCC